MMWSNIFFWGGPNPKSDLKTRHCGLLGKIKWELICVSPSFGSLLLVSDTAAPNQRYAAFAIMYPCVGQSHYTMLETDMSARKVKYQSQIQNESHIHTRAHILQSCCFTYLYWFTFTVILMWISYKWNELHFEKKKKNPGLRIFDVGVNHVLVSVSAWQMPSGETGWGN